MEPDTTQPPRRKMVLVVENDRVLSNILLHALEKEGISANEARNGIEGLEVIATAVPNLILLDIDMPKMDGITMLKELRAHGNNTPVMMLTNINDPERIADATEHGACGYLIKADWEIDEVVAKIKERLIA